MKLIYWNEETGKYDLIRQLKDMADARERMKDMPLPVFNVKYNSPDETVEPKIDNDEK